jgi:putative NADH-flavin reductase
MRLAMVGATGRTGSRLLEVALERGHSVRALRRTPAPPSVAVPSGEEPGDIGEIGEIGAGAGGSLTWIQGDVLDPSAVARLASGAEAMIVTLGPRADSPPDLCLRGTAAVISACRAFRIRRLVVLTGAMIGHPRDRLAMLLRTMWRTYTVVRPTQAADREAQDRLVIDSGLDWTLVRPPRLIDGERTEGVSAGSQLFVPARAQATIGDVVDVMIDAIERDMWIRSGVTVLSDAEAATEPDLSEGPFATSGGAPIPVDVQWDLDGDDDSDDPTLRDARSADATHHIPGTDPGTQAPPPDDAPQPAAPEDRAPEADDDGDWDLAPDLDSDDRSAGGSG